jgi:hypothetical protein
MAHLSGDRNTLLLGITCFLMGMIVMILVLHVLPLPEKQVIFTKKAPGPIGPYSQAVYFDNLVYTSLSL